MFLVARLAKIQGDECPPLLRRAIRTYVMRRQLELAGGGDRRRRSRATITVA